MLRRERPARNWCAPLTSMPVRSALRHSRQSAAPTTLRSWRADSRRRSLTLHARWSSSTGASSSSTSMTPGPTPRSRLRLLALARVLLQLFFAHARLGLLAFPLALQLGAHELALFLGLRRHL